MEYDYYLIFFIMGFNHSPSLCVHTLLLDADLTNFDLQS